MIGCSSFVSEMQFVAVAGTPAPGYTYRWTFDLLSVSGTTYVGSGNYYLSVGPGASYVPALGEACPGDTLAVSMSVADYNIMRSHMSGVTTSDVALLTSAVMLVWAVAWLSKRAVRVLIPNG